MDLLGLMQTFVRVVEAGSFTAVADERHTSQPTISRQIAALEQHLGARLLTRTTRALTMTDDGRSFYEGARYAIETILAAEGSVGRRRGVATGMLRIASPVVFGRLQILPRLPAFMARYPDVTVDLTMTDSFTDLIEQGIDLAIRVGEITDPGLIAKRIGTVQRICVASPAYLAGRKAPLRPQDLCDHDCIVYTRLATGSRWLFESKEGPIAVDVSGRYRTDNSEGIREGVLAGLGIAVIPAFAFADEVSSGKVKVLLRKFEPKRLPMHAVYPSRRFVPLKVRAMIDYLAHEFALVPSLSAHMV
jgi:DNA-binding transcriptional LysR family regulator